MKKICFVGGGTGGHILPLKNLIEISLKKKADVSFVLADQDLDREIFNKNFQDLKIKPYFLKTGKIRRYFAWKNFVDFFQIPIAFFRARKMLKEIQPDVLFFKGGFVSFPILIAAKFMFSGFKGKIYLHESDSTPSNLAKFISRYTEKNFSNFGENPMRLFYSNKKSSHQSLTPNPLPLTPKILIFGGSQGAVFINETFQKNAKAICDKYQVTLISGPGKSIDFKHQNFKQAELLPVEAMAKKIANADLIISRGSASIFQILENKKPSIIIPLPSAARDHQFYNASFFEKKDLVKLLEQNTNTAEKLVSLIEATLGDEKLKQNLKESDIKNNASEIAAVILG